MDGRTVLGNGGGVEMFGPRQIECWVGLYWADGLLRVVDEARC